jgi:hypothetical protein
MRPSGYSGGWGTTAGEGSGGWGNTATTATGGEPGGSRGHAAEGDDRSKSALSRPHTHKHTHTQHPLSAPPVRLAT